MLIENAIKESLSNIFLNVNKKLKELYPEQAQKSGATAIIAYLFGAHLFIAHTGDSRALWGEGTEHQTTDHVTYNSEECKRFTEGQIIINDDDGQPRVANEIIPTRGFGDFYCTKKTNGNFNATPEITVIDLEKDNIVIMGCDGVWEDISIQNDKGVALPDNTWTYTMVKNTLTRGSVSLALKELFFSVIFFDGGKDRNNYKAACTLYDQKAQQNVQTIMYGDNLEEKQSLINKRLFSLNEKDLDDFIQKFALYPFDNTTAIIIHAINKPSSRTKIWGVRGLFLLFLMGGSYTCWKYRALVIHW